MQDRARPPRSSCCRPCSLRCSTGQERGEGTARLILQRDGWAQPPGLLLCQPCGDRWLLSTCRPPSKHPQRRQPRASASKPAPRSAAFNLLWFEGLEKEGCQERVRSRSSSCLAINRFVFPLKERWGRLPVLLAPDPSTALRGIAHPSRHPQGCGQRVWGRLTQLPLLSTSGCSSPTGPSWRRHSVPATSRPPPAQGSPQAQAGLPCSIKTQTLSAKSKQTLSAPNARCLRRRWVAQQSGQHRGPGQPRLGASAGLGIPAASTLLRGFQHQE